MNESNNYWEPEPSELERAVKEAHLQPKKIKELLEKTKRIERSFPPSDNLQISIYRQLIVIQQEAYTAARGYEIRYHTDDEFKAKANPEDEVEPYLEIMRLSNSMITKLEEILEEERLE